MYIFALYQCLKKESQAEVIIGFFTGSGPRERERDGQRPKEP